jgi:hypothetical protein
MDYLGIVKSHVERLPLGAIIADPTEELPSVEWGPALSRVMEMASQLPDNGESVEEAIQTLMKPVDTFAKHVRNWAHQTARFDSHIADLRPKTVVIVMDFKEKIRKGKTTVQRQQDYFGGDYMSLMGAVVYYTEGGVSKKKNILFTSEDTNQDTDWVIQALDLVMETILDVAPDDVELEFWKDSGPHYHNNILLSKFKMLLQDNPKIAQIRDEYFEPGEAKSVVDQLFATVGGEITHYVGLGNQVNSAEDLQCALKELAHTTVLVHEPDRAEYTSSYEFYKGMTKYLSYSIARDDPRRKWRARLLTLCGASVVLHGSVITRDKKLSKEESVSLLGASLRRTTDAYNGASDLLTSLVNAKSGGVIENNDGFTVSKGKPNAAGEALVTRLAEHLSSVYPEDLRAGSSRPRLPTGWVALIIKTESLYANSSS